MRVWIAAALFTLGLLDLEFGGLAARWETRATATTSETQEQMLMESPGGGFPPK